MSRIELTEEEEALLDRYLDFYESLASGDREPTTEAQDHFVKVTRGKAGAATPHELAYAKFMRLRAQTNEANWQALQAREEPEPPPEWYSREDHGKLRARQHSDWVRRIHEV